MADQAASTSKDGQVRVTLAQRRAEPAGGVALAVVFPVAVLVEDGFKVEGKDFLVVRMEHDSSESGVMIGSHAVAVRARRTVVAVKFG